MPDGDKLVQLPSGEKVQFPASMPDSAVNAAIEQYIGGKQPSAPAEANRGFMGTVADKLKAAFKSMTADPTGGRPLSDPRAWLDISATTPPMIRQATRPLPQDLPTDVLGGRGTPGAGPVGRGIYRAATTLSPLVPFLDPEAMERASAKGDVGAVAAEATVPAAAALAPAMMKAVRGTGTGAMREVMGEGASKARVLADQHAHALATKQHLSTLADAVHTDAQQAMSQVLAKVDEAKPGGAFSKTDIQAKVGDAMGDLVKVPEKMPSSVAKILREEKGAEPPAVGGRKLNLKDPGDLAAYQRMKASGAFTPEEVKSIEGVGDNLTAEQLKQMRSDVGQELARYGEKGTIGAGLKKVYGVLSQELRNAARDAGVESDWLTANNKYSQYATDFTRKGPLKLALTNQTAAGIMEPLTGTARQVAMDTLAKYRAAGFNVDLDWVEGQMRHYSMGKTTLGLSKPTKMDLLMAGFSPKALAIRQLGPRLFRNPKVLSRFSGAEDVPMPARQVYPSKSAAMKAAKEAPRGRPDIFEGEGEPEIERLRRGPSREATPPTKEEVEGAQERKERGEAEKRAEAWMRGRKKKEKE